MVSYRPYQEEGISAVWSEWNRGVRSTLVANATGTGKTVMSAGIAERMQPGQRMLFFVHRDELAKQSREKFENITSLSVGLEMRNHGRNKTHSGRAQIIIAGVQSMAKRLKLYAPDEFDIVGVDECHRYVGNSWSETVSHFTAKHRFGLTATPKRHDGKALGAEWDTIAYEYPTSRAIEDGWLVPFRTRVVRCSDINLDSISVRAGDFSSGQLSKQLTKHSVVGRIVSQTAEIAGSRQGIVFCADVAQANAVHAEFLANGLTAIIITGKTPPFSREHYNARFKSGAAQFFVCVGVATEGYDHPGIGVVALARPTLSQPLYIQMAGRGSRPIEPPDVFATANERRAFIAQGEKPFVTLIDFVGNTSKHRLMFAADLLAGYIDDEVRKVALELASKRTDEIDPQALMTEAKEIVAERRKRGVSSTALAVEFDFGGLQKEKAFTFRFVHPFEVLGLNKAVAESEISKDDAYGENLSRAVAFLEECKLKEKERLCLTNRQQVYLGRVL